MLHEGGRAIAVDLELTWLYPLSELRSEQMRALCVNQVDIPLIATTYYSVASNALFVLVAIGRHRLLISSYTVL